MSRPALAYVVNSLNPGGTEKLVVEMGLAFKDEFDLQVWCLDEPGAWAPRLRSAGVPVHGLWRQPGIDLSVPARLARQLRQAGADIVHAHQCSPWFYAALSRVINPRPRLLLEEHGRFWPEPDSPRRRRVNRLAINRLTHRFIAVSQDIAQRLERYEGIPRDRIEVIYNGVAPAEPLEASAREALRATLGVRPDEILVGTVGRLDPIKNLPMLIEALRQVGATYPGVRGLIVGDGPQRSETARRLGEAGLSDRVIMTGHRDDACLLLPCMDVFVLASLSEGTSVALLEAMSAAVPPVVTAVGGNPELVEDGRCGWVVPSGNAGALAAALTQAADDPQLRLARGLAAQRRFTRRFTLSMMIDAYRALYRDMLDGAPASRPSDRVSAA
jgi:glycosyltransferase involved in cell wall biosynthesis